MDRDGIPTRTMVTGGHPRREGRGVSSPVQDAIALRAALSLWIRDGWYTRGGTAGGPATPKLQHMTSLVDAVDARIDGGQKTILRALRRCALEWSLPVYLVGGPVRDALMDLPIHDLDFVVEGDAAALARDLAGELDGKIVVHQAFGTASISLGNDRIDIVTARKEVYPHPGALPRVTPGTIADDLARRDFSINAMALPLRDGRRRLLDLHGGVRDLEAGLIRTLHAGSFVDDPTRVFRVARYEQRLGFQIEENTFRQLEPAVACGQISGLSPDRARHEIERILNERQPGLPLVRLAMLGGLSQLSPSLSCVEAVERMAAAVRGGETASPMMYLAALVYPLTPMQGEALVQRLNMPNSWARVVRDTLTLTELEGQLASPTLANSQIVRILKGLSEDAIRAVSVVSFLPDVGGRLREYLFKLRLLSPKLDGNDMLAMGARPGPAVGRILRELCDAKFDGQLDTVEDERRFIRETLAGNT